jgi:transposase
MRQKSCTIKPKDIKIAIIVLNIFVTIMERLPCLLLIFPALKGYVNSLLDTFKNLEPVKDSENSGLPTGKQIHPNKKPTQRRKLERGGQKGHQGTTHEKDPNPDVKVELTPDKEKYENNPDWRVKKQTSRQVIDLNAEKQVTEYTVTVYENIHTGEIVSGEFPEGVPAPVQFGPELKRMVILLRDEDHMSYERIATFIYDQFGIAISEATLVNMVTEAENSPVLDDFEEAAEKELSASSVLNADETGLNVAGKNFWAHILTNGLFVLFFLHLSRGKEAVEAMGIILKFMGVLVHDSWRTYFGFSNCIHALCNAHIIRELNLAIEMGQDWALDMQELLLDLCVLTACHGGVLPSALQDWARKEYRAIIDAALAATGGEILARPPGQAGKKGRIAKPKYRNLLERLRDFETAVLRFMTNPDVPFTNNNAERPIRMLKVHMKISGCFCSEKHARGFCRMRGYLVTCKKHGISAGEAIRMIVNNEVPQFIREALSLDKNNDSLRKAA